MADDSPQLKALQDQLACAQAERDITALQLATAQARQQLQNPVQQAAAAKVTAEAQTALYNQVKAGADAKTAVIAADTAAVRSQFGSVIGTSLTGEVAVGSGAGNAGHRCSRLRRCKTRPRALPRRCCIDSDRPPISRRCWSLRNSR